MTIMKYHFSLTIHGKVESWIMTAVSGDVEILMRSCESIKWFCLSL